MVHSRSEYTHVELTNQHVEDGVGTIKDCCCPPERHTMSKSHPNGVDLGYSEAGFEGDKPPEMSTEPLETSIQAPSGSSCTAPTFRTGTLGNFDEYANVTFQFQDLDCAVSGRAGLVGSQRLPSSRLEVRLTSRSRRLQNLDWVQVYRNSHRVCATDTAERRARRVISTPENQSTRHIRKKKTKNTL